MDTQVQLALVGVLVVVLQGIMNYFLQKGVGKKIGEGTHQIREEIRSANIAHALTLSETVAGKQGQVLAHVLAQGNKELEEKLELLAKSAADTRAELNKNLIASTERLDTITDLTVATHDVVTNGGWEDQLKATADALKRVAEVTKGADDARAAAMAEAALARYQALRLATPPDEPHKRSQHEQNP